MADEQSSIFDTLSFLNKGVKAFDWASKLYGGTSLGTGGYLPGAVAAYQGPGAGAAVASGATLASAMPFLGLAGFNIMNMLSSKLADNPSFSFSGLNPEYGVGNGKYVWYDRPTAQKALEPSSQKYNYHVGVNDTDQDPQVAKQLVQYFDNYFDQLSAQGVPVNEMLDRNKMFKFGGSLGEFEKRTQEIRNHFKPDITAYASGQMPPQRTISAEPVGPRADGLPGKTVFDATNTKSYGPTGADGYKQSTPLSGRDGFDSRNSSVTYGRGGEDRQQEILPRGDKTITIPGGSTAQKSLPAQGGNTMATAFVPSNIPSYLQPGFTNLVNDSDQATDQYQGMADELWEDYLNFEKTFFGKYEDNQQQYQDNLSSMPQVNLKMPGTMGGGTVPLAPKVHSAMFTDQFNAMNQGIGSQANSQLAGMGSRDALAKNMFQTNMQNMQNSFLPTQAGMDLYQMERAGQLGIDRANAGKYEPSTMSTWAPVVGSFLQSGAGSSAIDGLWDVGSGLWDAGSSLVGSVWDALPFT